MNLPNRLTIGRLILCVVLLIVLEIPWDWRGTLALVIFVVASLTDWVDGYLARKWNLITDFGKLFDPLADKILVSLVFIYTAANGLIPAWVVVCIISREFLITGLRGLAAAKGVILAAERIGKHKTISQMITAILALMIMALHDASLWPGVMSKLHRYALEPMIWITLFVTVYSGAAYYLKNREHVFQKETPKP